MIGLDTNVLIRYFTQDDAEQAAHANKLIEELSEAEPGFVSAVVLAETYWVLRDAYQVERASIVDVLTGVLDSKEMVVERSDTVRRALRRAAQGADLADSLINEIGADAGCRYTATFDRRAAKRAGMRLLA